MTYLVQRMHASIQIKRLTLLHVNSLNVYLTGFTGEFSQPWAESQQSFGDRLGFRSIGKASGFDHRTAESGFFLCLGIVVQKN